MANGLYLEDLTVGMSAEYIKTVGEAEVETFAGLSGDTNPVHLDADYAATTMFKERIAHGMLSAAFLSTVFGTRLPGPGCIYLSQTLKFLAPVKIGATVKALVTVKEIMAEKKRVIFETSCWVGETQVIAGEALIMVPARPVQSVAAE